MKLKNIRIDEISIVDKGANKKTYALFKRDPIHKGFGSADPEVRELEEMLEMGQQALDMFDQLLAMENAEKREQWAAYMQRQHEDAVELGYRITGAPRYEDTPAGWAARERRQDMLDQQRRDRAREARD